MIAIGFFLNSDIQTLISENIADESELLNKVFLGNYIPLIKVFLDADLSQKLTT